jgi:hypothetical protein
LRCLEKNFQDDLRCGHNLLKPQITAICLVPKVTTNLARKVRVFPPKEPQAIIRKLFEFLAGTS